MNPFSNDAPSEIRDRVSNELRDAAKALPVNGDATRAIARAEQRRQRRTIATAIAGVVTVAGLGIGAFALRPESATSVVAASDDVQTDAAGRAVLTLEWRTTKADVDWPAASFVGSDGYRYALSTAPGTRYGDLDQYDRVPQAIYRTADGENWESVTPSDTYLSGLGSRDGVLYSVSTSAGANGQIVASVVSSIDNGSEWTGVELPFVFGAVEDPNGLLFPVTGQPVSLAVGDDAMIATASQTRFFDDLELVDFLGLTGDSIYSAIEVGDDGTRVILRDYAPCTDAWATIEAEGDPLEYPGDPAECVNPPVVADVSPAELGISGDLVQEHSLISTDGVAWSVADVPGAQVWFAGGVFIAAATDPVRGLAYARSVDGLSWSPVDSGPFESLDIVGASNGVLVGRAYRSLSSTNVLTLSFDGGVTWTDLAMTDLSSDADAETFIATMAAGDLGIVAVLGDNSADNTGIDGWTIVTSGDGVNWSAKKVTDVDGIDAGYPGWAFVDADRVGVVFNGAKRNADGSVAAVTVLGTPTR